MCLPGSIHSKEFIAGEPLLDCPKCRRQDILAALAPKYLALNEGGPEYHLDMIRYAYQLHDSLERLQITHYPKYQDETKRSKTYEPPLYGLSEEDFFAYSNCDAYDHSYRETPSLQLLKKAFFE